MPLFGQKPKFKGVATPTIRIEKTVVVEKIKPKPSPSPASSSSGKQHASGKKRLSAGTSSGGRASSKSASPGADSNNDDRPSSAKSLKRKAADSLRDGPSRRSPAIGGGGERGARRVTFADDSDSQDDEPTDDAYWDKLRATGPRAEARRRLEGEAGADGKGAGTAVDTDRVLRNPRSFLPRRRRKAVADNEAAVVDGAGKALEPDDGASETDGEEDLQFVHAADVASIKTKCTPVLGAAPDEVAVELQYPGSRVRER